MGVQESSTFGDPEPLFGAPIVPGDQLLFFPTNFSANSAGGGVDQTGAQLQTTLMATNGTTLTAFNITEFGDTTLTGLARGPSEPLLASLVRSLCWRSTAASSLPPSSRSRRTW